MLSDWGKRHIVAVLAGAALNPPSSPRLTKGTLSPPLSERLDPTLAKSVVTRLLWLPPVSTLKTRARARACVCVCVCACVRAQRHSILYLKRTSLSLSLSHQSHCVMGKPAVPQPTAMHPPPPTSSSCSDDLVV